MASGACLGSSMVTMKSEWSVPPISLKMKKTKSLYDKNMRCVMACISVNQFDKCLNINALQAKQCHATEISGKFNFMESVLLY